MHRMHSAEQRWPALSKAEATTSLTTCSVRAEESTIIASRPSVSAINGIGRPCASKRPAMLRCRMPATSVGPVNITPRTRASFTSAAPTLFPWPGSSCTVRLGNASFQQDAHCLCGHQRGFLGWFSQHSALLPAANAAAIWPVKIASGRFHGLMHTTGPSGRWCTWAMVCMDKGVTYLAPVVIQEIDRFSHLSDSIVEGFPGFTHQNAHQAG